MKQNSKQKTVLFHFKIFKTCIILLSFLMSESKRSELQFNSQLVKVGTENKSRFFNVPKSEFRQKSEESHPWYLRRYSKGAKFPPSVSQISYVKVCSSKVWFDPWPNYKPFEIQ